MIVVFRFNLSYWKGTRTRLSRSLEQATLRYLLEIFVIRDLQFLTFNLSAVNDKRDSWIIFVIISVIFDLVNQWATQLSLYVKIRCVSVKEYLRSFVTPRETIRWFNVTEFLIERHPRITVEPPLTATPLQRPLFFVPADKKIHTRTLVSTSLQPAKNTHFNWLWIKQFKSRFMWRDRVWLTAHQ